MDPDPFIIDLQEVNIKQTLKKSFCACYFLKVDVHHFLKRKKSKEVTKQKKSRFFLLLLLNDRRIRIQEVQKHVDPDLDSDDPDPQHWLKE
jgi:hypothetical protein